MSKVLIGISGWKYKGQRGAFYPLRLPLKRELEFASQRFPLIEINKTFHALHRPSTYERWYDLTPEDFIFSVKTNRYISHLKRLQDIEIPMGNFLASGVLLLQEKLGPLLWQFSPNIVFDPDRWKSYLDLLLCLILTPRVYFPTRTPLE